MSAIQDITELIDALIDLFPTTQPEQKRLCADEGMEIAKGDSASLIVPIFAEQDPDLTSAIKSRQHKEEGQVSNITFAGDQNRSL